MQIDTRNIDSRKAHDLLKGCVAPRPIAWISTLNADRTVNAAPYSCFTFVATEPPMVCFSVERRLTGHKKDTLVNVEQTGDFVVNMVSYELAEAMNQCAEDLPYGVSELARAGLEPYPSETVASPRIAESPVSLECRVADVMELGRSRHSLVIGEVLLLHIRDDLYADGTVDLARLRPVGRLAGNHYCRLGEAFELPRPWLGEDS